MTETPSAGEARDAVTLAQRLIERCDAMPAVDVPTGSVKPYVQDLISAYAALKARLEDLRAMNKNAADAIFELSKSRDAAIAERDELFEKLQDTETCNENCVYYKQNNELRAKLERAESELSGWKSRFDNAPMRTAAEKIQELTARAQHADAQARKYSERMVDAQKRAEVAEKDLEKVYIRGLKEREAEHSADRRLYHATREKATALEGKLKLAVECLKRTRQCRGSNEDDDDVRDTLEKIK